MKFYLGLLTALLPALSLAYSENYLPGAGGHVLTPGLAIAQLDYKSKTNSNVKGTAFVMGAEYRYGLLENLALTGRLGWNNSKLEVGPTGATSNQTSTGLLDPKVGILGETAMSGFKILYGASLSIPLEANTQKDSGNGDIELNGANGLLALTPQLGIEFGSGFHLGMLVQREIALQQAKYEYTDATGIKTTGDEEGDNASQTTFYFELPLSSGLVGGFVRYNSYDASTIDFGTNGKSESASRSSWSYAGYGELKSSENLTWAGALIIVRDNSSAIKEQATFGATAEARISF